MCLLAPTQCLLACSECICANTHPGLCIVPVCVPCVPRRAQAHMSLNEPVEAECDIKGGLMSHPDNTDLAALYRKLK